MVRYLFFIAYTTTVVQSITTLSIKREEVDSMCIRPISFWITGLYDLPYGKYLEHTEAGTKSTLVGMIGHLSYQQEIVSILKININHSKAA